MSSLDLDQVLDAISIVPAKGGYLLVHRCLNGPYMAIHTNLDELVSDIRDRLTATAFQKATDQAFENLHNRDEDLPPAPANLGARLRRKLAARDDDSDGPSSGSGDDGTDRR